MQIWRATIERPLRLAIINHPAIPILGINHPAIPIEAQVRPSSVLLARDRVVARQCQLAQATVIPELNLRRTRFDRDAVAPRIKVSSCSL